MQTDGHISPDFYDSYFQRYPHNHPVTILLYWVLKAAGKLGVSVLYWPSHLLGLVSIDLALLFMWKLACETEDIHRGFLVAVLSLFDPIIYIWIPWHYTTVCLLPFLSAGIYFGWKTWKAVNLRSQIIYAACTGIFTAVGMRIRITEGILLIAFLIMAVCVKGWNRCRLAACLIPFLVICGLTWAGTGMLRNHYADFDSSDKAFPPAHFVMMGVGGDGTYKKKDVEFTARIPGEEAKTKAQAVGAKGFKLVGCTCVGQDLQLRGAHYTEIFDGHAGNNYTSEAILATGAIDAVLSEFNCTLPGIEPICEELKIRQICLDDVAKKANAELMPFEFENREEQSSIIIDKIIESYKERRGSVALHLMEEHGNDHTLTGVSEGSLKSFLGGKWTPLIELLASGEIKGLAGVVGCSNLTAGGHDVLSVELTKELISRDILVLTAGCSSGGIENCGLMTPEAAKYAGPKLRAVCEKLNIPPVLNFGPCLAIGRLEIVATEIAAELGVDLPQLPLVLSAAQWLEEQALADGCFGLALGLPLHLGLPPFVTGSKTAVKVLTEDMKELTGGQVIINGDAKESADILEQIILEKRQGLHI